jgi:dTDP-4-dehydrorhamnose 3,5-epimerase
LVHATPTALPEVLIVEPDVHRDARGLFAETFRVDAYRALGIPDTFVQDNHSQSARGTVRGLHMQVRRPQAKLIRVVVGHIYDVAVDLRRGSPRFGRWVGVELSADNWKQCYIPTGFGHGFAVLSETALVEYKCSDYYDPEGEVTVAWNDPTLAIDWPVTEAILSPRDQRSPGLDGVMERLPVFA